MYWLMILIGEGVEDGKETRNGVDIEYTLLVAAELLETFPVVLVEVVKVVAWEIDDAVDVSTELIGGLVVVVFKIAGIGSKGATAKGSGAELTLIVVDLIESFDVDIGNRTNGPMKAPMLGFKVVIKPETLTEPIDGIWIDGAINDAPPGLLVVEELDEIIPKFKDGKLIAGSERDEATLGETIGFIVWNVGEVDGILVEVVVVPIVVFIACVTMLVLLDIGSVIIRREGLIPNAS